jgi:DNA helicase-2/ATP-dependent DNA helicase PcrA
VHAPVAPLLVLAGAGTGKTRVVIARIAELVRRGSPPSRILAVTFTNKAAREMLSRLPKLRTPGGSARSPRASAPPQPDLPEISTIHSLCCRILRRNAERAGYTPRFGICDRTEQEAIARRVLKEIRVAEATLTPAQLLDRVGRWKTAGLDPDESIAHAEDDVAQLAASGYRRYQRALENAGLVDFDDLLVVVDRLFRRHEDIRHSEAARFDHVLVDEYQDTSSIQDRILAGLARDHESLCVVGDDDQSIYAWRGAEVSHILQFKQSWPTATVVRLEENYRSTPEIIRAANLLIGHNARRLGKTLVSRAPSGPPPAVLQAEDELDEAKRVVGELADRLRLGECAPSEAAILVRIGELTRSFEQELRRRGVPYELVGSRSFFDRREVKDVMALTRLLVDPDDDLALARVANAPPRGLSPRVLEAGRRRAAAERSSLWRALVASAADGGLPPAAAAGVGEIERALQSARAAAVRDAHTIRPSEALVSLLASLRYREHLEQEYEDAAERQERLGCVEELVNGLARASARPQGASPAGVDPLAASLSEFLDELVLDVQQAERFRSERRRGDAVKLMTLHAAKGLEFDAVWMVGMEENILPHHRALAEDGPGVDEERRLCYVGVTRARKRLTLSLCLTRLKWGKPRRSLPSRFLYELTGQPERFAERAEESEPPQHPRAARKDRTRRDVRPRRGGPRRAR